MKEMIEPVCKKTFKDQIVITDEEIIELVLQ